MPVRLPAKVARPPGADSWLADSAVKVSAVVIPRPSPAASNAILARPGCGRGTADRATGQALPIPRTSG